MNARFELHLDQADFDRWLDAQEGRYEWKEGRVVQMANVTLGHARVARNFLLALVARLDATVWDVLPSDFGVQRPNFTRFPDVLVERLQSDPKVLRSHAPVLLIEVLSPSSVGVDMTEKPAEYMSFESLEAYIVASQDEPICWIWQRSDPNTAVAAGAARLFPPKPAEIAGRDQAISVPSLGIALPLVEIYRGIGTT